MSVIKVPTNFNIELEFEVPPFYKRFLSLLIDMLVEYLYLVIIFQLLKGINSGISLWDTDGRYNLQTVALIAILPVMLYHVTCETLFNGQSMGKKIMKLRVVDEQGGRPSFSQYVIRWLLRLSDLWLVTALVLLAEISEKADAETIFITALVIGFLITDIVLVSSSAKGQRLGDILARTIIINTKNKEKIEDTIFQEVEEGYQPVFTEVMRLSDRDMNTIKKILDAARKSNNLTMATDAAEKVKSHLKIESPLDSFSFLSTVLKDYNYLSVK